MTYSSRAYNHHLAGSGYSRSTELPPSFSEKDKSNTISQVSEGWHSFPSDPTPYFANGSAQLIPPSPSSSLLSSALTTPEHSDLLSSSSFSPHMYQTSPLTTAGYSTMIPFSCIPRTPSASDPTQTGSVYQNTSSAPITKAPSISAEDVSCRWGCPKRLSRNGMRRHERKCQKADDATRLAVYVEGLCPVPGCRRSYSRNDRLVNHFQLKHRGVIVPNPPQLKRASPGRKTPTSLFHRSIPSQHLRCV